MEGLIAFFAHQLLQNTALSKDTSKDGQQTFKKEIFFFFKWYIQLVKFIYNLHFMYFLFINRHYINFPF